MNATILNTITPHMMNMTSTFIMNSATNMGLPRMDPMVTFYTIWGLLFFIGLMEVVRLSSREEEVPAPHVIWNFVGNHPDLKTPTPVYRREYASGKASYRWRKSDKSPWTYGSNPLDA